jgi:hypothetical protein
MRNDGNAVAIHRVREVVDRDGGRTTGRYVVRLERLEADELELEAAEHGLVALERRHVPETDEHVGSVVVMLRG